MSPEHTGFFEGTEMPVTGWWGALWPDPAGVLAAVGLKPCMDVVDLCSGDGWFTLRIAEVARRVIAVDIDAQMLEVARLRLQESGATNWDLIEGSAYDVQRLVRARHDFVFMANAFHGVPDKPRLARAVKHILAPGARFAIVNWHARPREQTVVLGEPRGPKTELRLSPDETAESVQPSGLRLAELVELPPYHYCAVFEHGT